MYALRNIAAQDTLNVTAGAFGSSGISASGAATTAYTNELVFGANIVATGASSAGTGFTSRLVTGDGDIVEDNIVSAMGSYNACATLMSPGAWVMQMATFHQVRKEEGLQPDPASGGDTYISGKEEQRLASNESGRR